MANSFGLNAWFLNRFNSIFFLSTITKSCLNNWKNRMECFEHICKCKIWVNFDIKCLWIGIECYEYKNVDKKCIGNSFEIRMECWKCKCKNLNATKYNVKE